MICIKVPNKKFLLFSFVCRSLHHKIRKICWRHVTSALFWFSFNGSATNKQFCDWSSSWMWLISMTHQWVIMRINEQKMQNHIYHKITKFHFSKTLVTFSIWCPLSKPIFIIRMNSGIGNSILKILLNFWNCVGGTEMRK